MREYGSVDTVGCMKTTIELPDALAQQAKSYAAEHATTLRDLVVEGLRAELDRRQTRSRPDFVFPTVGGRGLRVEVDAGALTDYAYDLPR